MTAAICGTCSFSHDAMLVYLDQFQESHTKDFRFEVYSFDNIDVSVQESRASLYSCPLTQISV